MGRIGRQLKLSKLKQNSLHWQCVSTGGGSTCRNRNNYDPPWQLWHSRWGSVDVQFGHWSIQWVDILHNQHFWFTSLSRKLLIPHRHIDAWHSVSYFSVVLWPSFVTSFRMSSKTLLLPVWCDILWFPRNGTKLCGHQSTFFVQWSLTCDYYPYDFVAQLPKGCWNFSWPGVLSHKSGRYPDHVKAWIQWCLA